MSITVHTMGTTDHLMSNKSRDSVEGYNPYTHNYEYDCTSNDTTHN